MSSGTHRDEGIFGGAATSWAHYSDLVMYARRVLGDRSDTAEDVVQEAYLRLLGLAASDESPSSARPWLFRVVRNLAIDERRSAARRADPVADTAILGTAAIDDTVELVEQREEIAGALRDIAALPPRERRAIEMDQAGIGAQAIAVELDTTPNAVHQALFRARKRLRGARAVAWGLIPVGLIPLALRASDPALAVAAGNLPPGLPIGRAIPVAGLVAVAMVGGSVVAPDLDQRRGDVPAAEAIAKAIAAQHATAAADSDDDAAPVARTVVDNRGPSGNSGPGPNSGKGNAGDDDKSGKRDDDEDGDKVRGRNRGSGGGGDDDADDGDRRRGKGSGSSGGGDDDDDAPATSGSGSKKGSSGSGSSSGKGSGDSGSGSSKQKAPSTDDQPDAPDAPDEPDDND